MIARRMIDFPSRNWPGPAGEMAQMIRQLDRLTQAMIGRTGMGWLASRVFPAVNITEDKSAYHVRAELPGIKADALDLQVKGRNLTIAGERAIRPEGENARYHRREREAGRFSRVIGLPGDIDADRVTAKMANGVLMVTVAKSEASKPKQITVN